MSNNTETEKVYVVSHTHWDREWYQDFQAFRTRLVYMIDELLEKLEQDPEYRFFMLDGQTIVIDDYLEIRPQNKLRLLKLIQEGKIAVGPWYAMPDEFLVSGESLIRNFLIGYRRSRSWGVEPVRSGFITDIFGHNSQFPQILQGFGIDNAVFFRGFGDCKPSEIWWEGVDGSRVLGLKLDEDRGYGDFFFFIRWPFAERDFEYDVEELVKRGKDMLEYKAERATTNIVLAMDGVDHIEIEPQLPWLLKTLNDKLGVEFEHTTLERYLQDLRQNIGDLEVYKGEQREPGDKGINNLVIANVLSSRIHLKQRNHACETSLEKWAEPWGVFAALEGRAYPQDFLSRAWEILIQNHPHDSICGCSIDQVHQDMIYRFDQTRLISNQMIKEQLVYISNHLNTEDLDGDHVFTVYNSSQSKVDGVVEVELALPANTDAASTMVHYGGTSFRIYDENKNEIPYQLLEVKKGSRQLRRPYRDIPHGDIVDRYRIALHAKVPSFGYVSYLIKKFKIEGPGESEYRAPKLTAPVRYPGSMQVDADTWNNGRINVQANTNGTIDIEDLESGQTHHGLLLFEDEADIGDGWDHVAPVTNEVFTSIGSKANISTVFDGPLHTRIRIRTSISVSTGVDPLKTRRAETFVDIPLTTYVDLKKNDPTVYCRTIVENTARDHRLRLLIPTELKADHYYTSNPFDLVERSVQKKDYSNYLEKDRNVVPHNGIISVDDNKSGFAVYSKGLYEATVRDDQRRTVAMTLFRSTGQEVLCDGSDGGQLLTQLEFEYALRPIAVNDNYISTLWKEHQQFVGGIRSMDRKIGKVYYETRQKRTADLPLSKSFLNISTSNLVVSAVKQAEDTEGRYIVRLLNIAEQETEGTLTFDRKIVSAQLVNLDEQPIRELQIDKNSVSLDSKPKQILTLRITF